MANKNPLKDYSKAFNEIEKSKKNKKKPQVFNKEVKETDSKYGTFYLSKSQNGESESIIEIKRLDDNSEEEEVQAKQGE